MYTSILFKKFLIFGFTLLVLQVSAQTNNSKVRLQNFPSLATPKGYSHAAVIDLGWANMIIFSGQVPLDKNGNLVAKGNFKKQTEQVFENIKSALTDLGGNMSDVIKIGIYLTDMKNIQLFRNVRDKYIDVKNPPASTLVQVNKLYRDEVLLEVEATAIIPKNTFK